MPAYCKELSENSLMQSMSRKGNYLGNAAMGSFFGTLKSEFFDLNKFADIENLRIRPPRYIRYYNNEGIRLKLNRLSPVDY